MTEGFKYFAFISYNERDTKWGKRLQRKLESYRMPSTLCSERGWNKKPINPVFFAPTDIQPGGLSAELQERLRASRNLIVICSPNSAKSEWVGKEIEYFNSLGRGENIHFFIVDGVPHSGNPDTECFNPIIEKLGLPEILGANVNEKVYRRPWLNRERAYVQLITKLLGVEFDAIWQRHKRLFVQKILCCVIGIIAVLAALSGVWITSQPIDAELRLNEVSVHNENLPLLKDAIVTLTLADETKTDTICSVEELAKFVNIPHSYLGEKVGVSVRCYEWEDVDTTVILDRKICIDMRRDESVYGNVYFRVYRPMTEEYIDGVAVSVAGIDAVSDSLGAVRIFVPLDRQRQVYPVISNIVMESDSIQMPSGESDVLIVSE